MNLASVATKDLDRWLAQPASTIAHHGDGCCEGARLWFHAMARSHDFGIADKLEAHGPSWLRTVFEWGANPWPAYWCDLMVGRIFDCGVFSALAREVFALKGIPAHAGQVIQWFGAPATAHWRCAWDGKPGAFAWIGDGFVYHEVTIVADGRGECRMYDPTDGFWMNAALNAGHGRTVAIRSEAPVALAWGKHILPPGRWLEIAEEGRDERAH